MVKTGTSMNQKTQSVSVTAPAFILHNITGIQKKLVICKTCTFIVIGSNINVLITRRFYLENYLKNISPEISNLARTLFCIFHYLFCNIWTSATLYIHRQSSRTILNILPLVTYYIATNFIVILITSIHGEHRSKLHWYNKKSRLKKTEQKRKNWFQLQCCLLLLTPK